MTNLSGLGEFLRQEREKKGITLDQVAAGTKINVRILHFLEADRYSELPAKPFVRGFVASYARFVNLDPNDILSRYEDFLETKSGITSGEYRIGNSVKKKSEQNHTRRLLIISAIIFSGVVVAGALVFRPKLDERRSKMLNELKLTAGGPPAVNAESGKPVVATNDEAAVVGAEAAPETAAERTEKSESSETQSAKTEAVTDAPVAPKPAPAEKPVAEKTEPPSETKELNKDKNIPDPDPLQKGDAYADAQVKYKVVLKSLTGVWVRYRVDDFDAKSIYLLGNKLLVLRAKRDVSFQVSNPRSVQIRNPQLEYRPLSEHPRHKLSSSGMSEVNIGERPAGNAPFAGFNSLPGTPGPGGSPN